MKKLIKKNRKRVDRELRNAKQHKFFSPSSYATYKEIASAINEYAIGKLIDLGCGYMQYKELILSKVSQYDSLDIEKFVDEVKFVSDLQNMDIIADSIYDSAVCFQVLEHVQNPLKAISEIYRILKKDGVFILSVPHLSRIHNEPYDFFRYTKYGLQYLLENAGFKIIQVKPQAGIFCFLGHQFSTIFICLFWHIPIIKHVAFFINKYFFVKLCYLLDKVFDKKKIFALGYVCVAKK